MCLWCECWFSEGFSAQSLWLASWDLYVKKTELGLQQLSLRRQNPPNSVLRVNAIKFSSTNQWILCIDMAWNAYTNAHRCRYICSEAGSQTSPSKKHRNLLPTCLPFPRRNAHGLNSALWAFILIPSHYQRCFCMREESALYISKHLSVITMLQSTAVGTDSSNHHFGWLMKPTSLTAPIRKQHR